MTVHQRDQLAKSGHIEHVACEAERKQATEPSAKAATAGLCILALIFIATVAWRLFIAKPTNNPHEFNSGPALEQMQQENK